MCLAKIEVNSDEEFIEAIKFSIARDLRNQVFLVVSSFNPGAVA